MLNRNRNFKVGIASRETISSMIAYDFQDSKVLTSILWRHSHTKFSDGSRNNCMQGASQLSTPVYS